jgi:HEAT repeat protein
MIQGTLMKNTSRLIAAVALLLLATNALAQSSDAEEHDSLKMAALEALITAPPERALPIVDKVLSGNNSVELKERALFILSQMETAESQERLLAFARDSQGELQTEAIRMIGIGGDSAALASLGAIYSNGDSDVREAVLEAYLIADDAKAIFDIAASTTDEEEFSNAVQLLGAMGANDQLRELRGQAGLSESLIEAYAISGDAETLMELARDDSNPDMQTQAIEALGIVGGDDIGQVLVGLYQDASNEEVKQAALDGLLISGDDSSVLGLYRNTSDPKEKRELLEHLVTMGSDEVWDLIDSALDGAQ